MDYKKFKNAVLSGKANQLGLEASLVNEIHESALVFQKKQMFVMAIGSLFIVHDMVLSYLFGVQVKQIFSLILIILGVAIYLYCFYALPEKKAMMALIDTAYQTYSKS